MIRNVIFDYGNVLVDWNPAYLFLPYFNGDEAKCRYFTDNICNREWFTRMDRGEAMDVCVADLQARYPEYAQAVAMFRDRWFDMCNGELEGMYELIQLACRNFPGSPTPFQDAGQHRQLRSFQLCQTG